MAHFLILHFLTSCTHQHTPAQLSRSATGVEKTFVRIFSTSSAANSIDYGLAFSPPSLAAVSHCEILVALLPAKGSIPCMVRLCSKVCPRCGRQPKERRKGRDSSRNCGMESIPYTFPSCRVLSLQSPAAAGFFVHQSSLK